MPTFEEFLATCGRTDGEFAPFYAGPPALNIPGMLPCTRPPRELQQEVYREIHRQMAEYVIEVCEKYPDDLWLPFHILTRAEKLVSNYVDEQFDELIPLQEEIRDICTGVGGWCDASLSSGRCCVPAHLMKSLSRGQCSTRTTGASRKILQRTSKPPDAPSMKGRA